MADLAARVATRPEVLEPGESVLAAARTFAAGYLKLRVLLFMIAIVSAYVVSQSINANASLLASASAGVAATVVAETLLNAIRRPPPGLANRMVSACTEDRLLFLATSQWTGLPTRLLRAIPISEVAGLDIEERRVSFWRFGHLRVRLRDGSATVVETTARGKELLSTIEARV